MSKPKIILGSGSPRRRELLAPFYNFQILKPAIDESPKRGEKSRAYLRRIVLGKWKDVEARVEALAKGAVILSADTIVLHREKILGKAKNVAEAKKMLKQLSNQSHQVITIFSVGRAGKKPKLVSESTKIEFRKLQDHEIQAYVDSGEWQGKAGAYAIQGKAAYFVSKVSGSLTNVIGLPLEKVLPELTRIAR